MAKGSFLTVFRDILHATEVAAAIAAPIVKTMDPEIAGLMVSATSAAVALEGSLTAPGSGDQKAAAVAGATQAAIDATNQILASKGKKQLPANTGALISSQVGIVVGNMNAIRDAVQSAPAAAPIIAPPPAAAAGV